MRRISGLSVSLIFRQFTTFEFLFQLQKHGIQTTPHRYIYHTTHGKIIYNILDITVFSSRLECEIS